MTAKCVDAPPKTFDQDCMFPLAPSITTSLFAKSFTVFKISLCLISLSSIFCNFANFHASATIVVFIKQPPIVRYI